VGSHLARSLNYKVFNVILIPLLRSPLLIKMAMESTASKRPRHNEIDLTFEGTRASKAAKTSPTSQSQGTMTVATKPMTSPVVTEELLGRHVAKRAQVVLEYQADPNELPSVLQQVAREVKYLTAFKMEEFELAVYISNRP
jgi:hypothetical protein